VTFSETSKGIDGNLRNSLRERLGEEFVWVYLAKKRWEIGYLRDEIPEPENMPNAIEASGRCTP
jgi:hypothetical protein